MSDHIFMATKERNINLRGHLFHGDQVVSYALFSLSSLSHFMDVFFSNTVFSLAITCE